MGECAAKTQLSSTFDDDFAASIYFRCCFGCLSQVQIAILLVYISKHSCITAVAALRTVNLASSLCCVPLPAQCLKRCSAQCLKRCFLILLSSHVRRVSNFAPKIGWASIHVNVSYIDDFLYYRTVYLSYTKCFLRFSTNPA